MAGRATLEPGCAIVSAMPSGGRIHVAEQLHPLELTEFEKAVAEVAGEAGARVAGEASARRIGQVLERARQQLAAQQQPPGSAPASPASSWAGVHHRAAEHEVTLAGQASAATPNGAFAGGPTYALDLAASWSTAAMPIVAATSIVEVEPGRGAPAVPAITDAPTAGPQNGEKDPAFTSAFTVGVASTATIDATLILNWSAQLEATPAAVLGWAMASAAVAAEADHQVGAAIVARGTAAATLDAALAVFATGRYLPTTLLIGPGGLGALGSYRAADLAALGIAVTLAKVSKPVLLDSSAVLGWLAPVQQTAVEPSRLGTTRGWAIFGAVGVDAAGVAVIG